MIAFKTMWKDISEILGNENQTLDFKVVERFTNGFVVRENDDTTFITKEDFVDFWCKLLYYNKISKNEVLKDQLKSKYIYDLVKKLPYVIEKQEILILAE